MEAEAVTVPKLKCQLMNQLFPDDIRAMVKHENRKIIQEYKLKSGNDSEYNCAYDYYHLIRLLEKMTGNVWIWSEREGTYYTSDDVEEILLRIKDQYESFERISGKFIHEHQTFQLYRLCRFISTLCDCYFMTEATYQKAQKYVLTHPAYFDGEM